MRRSLGLAALTALALTGLATPALAQRVTPGWIGIAYDVTETGTGNGAGARAWITDVSRGSPAESAGVRVGDRLLAIDGQGRPAEWRRLPERLRAGQEVALRVEREGRRIDLRLRASDRPSALLAERVDFAFSGDSMTNVMFRAMDSLRVHLLQASGQVARGAVSNAERISRFGVVAPGGRETVGAPFEFFVFRGERHDSLVREMETLNRQLAELRRREVERLGEVRRASRASRAEAQDRELTDLRGAIEELARASAELRTAMADAARATAGLDYLLPVDAPDAPSPPEPAADAFRPLTPYLLGSNRVAGAQVIDLRPELGTYFGVESGVLVVDVAPGTPAAIAGLVPGDVVTRIDRVGVRTVEDLRFGVAQSGDTLPLTLIRRGSSLQVLLRKR